MNERQEGHVINADDTCTNCKRPRAPNAKKCAACLASNARSKRERYQARIADGCCGVCSQPNSSGRSGCATCRERQRVKQVGWRERLRKCICGMSYEDHLNGSLKCSRSGTSVFSERKSA